MALTPAAARQPAAPDRRPAVVPRQAAPVAAARDPSPAQELRGRFGNAGTEALLGRLAAPMAPGGAAAAPSAARRSGAEERVAGQPGAAGRPPSPTGVP